nr:MAG TPA: hypothetical protein [Caudoviricetes sp.]
MRKFFISLLYVHIYLKFIICIIFLKAHYYFRIISAEVFY